MTIVVGIISDTHGLVRQQAKDALAGCDALVHAGDVGKPEVLDELRTIAPLTAIRGNVDGWAVDMPDTAVAELGGYRLYILHDLNELDIDPKTAGYDAVISGHSHKPRIVKDNDVLYLNPGSAGPRRFTLPVALAVLEISAGRMDARIIELDV